jgi:hypothetical protein
MFRAMMAAALVVLAGCQTKPANEINVEVLPDGSYRVASSGSSEEDQMLAALMQSVLNDELKDDAEAQEPLAEDEVWRADAAGNLTHIQSGGQCPLQRGEYTRGRTSIFQPDGTDVGCNYGSPNGAVLTFYVYQNTQALADELTETFETMKTRQPVSTEAQFANQPASKAYLARTLAYEAADGAAMRTSVLLADGGAWRLKMRLTCKADDAQRIEMSAGIALMGQADRFSSPQPARTEPRTPI